jgi:hypothetical protein
MTKSEQCLVAIDDAINTHNSDNFEEAKTELCKIIGFDLDNYDIHKLIIEYNKGELDFTGLD